MLPEYLSVGFVTKDFIDGREYVGGSAYYGARAAQKLGLRTALWTSCGDFPASSEFEGLDVIRTPSKETITFKLDVDRNTGHRTLHVDPLGDPIAVETLPSEWKRIPRVMLSPVWNEIGPETLKLFDTRYIGMGPQGWFRRRNGNNRVEFVRSPWETLPRKVELIVVSVDDIIHDPGAWDWIKRAAVVAVKTMGRRGHIVSVHGKEEHLHPPRVVEDVDPTGAGDVFATTMLIALSEGESPADAAQTASLAATFAVSDYGISGLPTREDIESRRKFMRSGSKPKRSRAVSVNHGPAERP